MLSAATPPLKCCQKDIVQQFGKTLAMQARRTPLSRCSPSLFYGYHKPGIGNKCEWVYLVGVPVSQPIALSRAPWFRKLLYSAISSWLLNIVVRTLCCALGWNVIRKMYTRAKYFSISNPTPVFWYDPGVMLHARINQEKQTSGMLYDNRAVRCERKKNDKVRDRQKTEQAAPPFALCARNQIRTTTDGKRFLGGTPCCFRARRPRLVRSSKALRQR